MWLEESRALAGGVPVSSVRVSSHRNLLREMGFQVSEQDNQSLAPLHKSSSLVELGGFDHLVLSKLLKIYSSCHKSRTNNPIGSPLLPLFML